MISRRHAIAGVGGLAAAGLGIKGSSPRAGTPLWHAQAPAGINALVPADGVVCMSIGYGSNLIGTLALDAATGRQAWKSYGGGYLFPIAAGPGMVFCAAYGGAVTAVNSRTGRVLWRDDLKAIIVDGVTPVVAVYNGGTVYTAASPAPYTTGFIVALGSAAGRRKWTVHTPAPISALAVADGVVYTGWAKTTAAFGPGVIVALDAATGARRWASPLSFVPNQLAVTGNAVVCGSNSPGGLIGAIALDARTGRGLWKSQGLPVTGIAAADGIVFTMAVSVQAIVARTGKQLWVQNSLNNPGFIALADGVLYAESYPSLYAVSAATGKQLRSYRQGNGAGGEIVMAAGNGIVYTAVGSLRGGSSTVYAVRA